MKPNSFIPFVLCTLATTAFAIKTVEDAEIISKVDFAKIYNSSGTDLNGGGFGGGYSLPHLFDNKWNEYIRLPKAGNDCYIVEDFTTTNVVGSLASGYYVTQIKIGAYGEFPFSLYYWPASGADWIAVTNNCVGTQATLVYPIDAIATQVKIVFHNCPPSSRPEYGWGYSANQISELQVWGLDPAEMVCTHPSYSEWELKEPATCTTRQIDHRYCNECYEEATQEVGSPLGHEYVTHLEKPGKCNRYGKGWIDCSRTNCDFRADFPQPIDMVTLGGFAELYKVQFTDVSVSTENNPAWWNTYARYLFDNKWEMAGGTFWAALTLDDEWVDFEFGTTIDPTWVEFSVPNHNHTVQFFARDGETETLLAEIPITKIETFEENVDPETGEITQVETSPKYQRMTVEFTEKHAKAVRIRFVDEIGITVHQGQCNAIGELHLYGTVKGAGHVLYDPTTLMIFR